MAGDDPLETLDGGSWAVRKERRELADETKAFEAFLERVKALDSDPVSAQSPPVLVGRPRPVSGRLRDAYTETVMSVPHFQAVYGESYQESLTRELNEELAVALATTDRFSPQLQRTLTDCVEEAIAARRSLIEFLEGELADIDATRDELEAIVRKLKSILEQPLDRAGFHVLKSSRERLGALEEDCGRLHRERQATIQREHSVAVAGIDDTAGYLYRPCNTNHPVLAAITRVCAEIESGYRMIDRRLAVVD